MAASLRRPVALVGLPGAGKSAVARDLAARLGASRADLDELIEAEAGRRIPEIFAREGEAGFRRREADLLRRALEGGAQCLACGGGLVMEAGNRALLRERCAVVWLEVEPAEAAARLGLEAAGRPLLGSLAEAPARLAELLAAREPFYREAAHVRVATTGRRIPEVGAAVLAALEARGEIGR
jgi:shikimate kinase